MITVADKKNIVTLVRHTVAEELRTVLSDPDFGLEFQDWVKKELKKKHKKTISWREIKKKYL